MTFAAAQNSLGLPLAPPASIEIEQAVLGACLMGRGAVEADAAILEPEDFSEGVHGAILAVIRSLSAAGSMVSPLTVWQGLKDQPAGAALAEIGGAGYLAQMMAAAPVPAALPDMVAGLREYRQRRDLIMVADDLRAAAHVIDLDHPLADIVAGARAGLDSAAEAGAGGAPRSLLDQTRSALDFIDRAQRGETSGLTTGLRALDDKLDGGLHPGNLIYLAGRPGMGKSTVAANMAVSAARAGVGVLYLSMEMSERQVMLRLLSDLLERRTGRRIGYSAMRGGRLSDEEHRALAEAAEDLTGTLPLRLDVIGGASVARVRAMVEAARGQMQRAHGGDLGLIILDQLSQMSARGQHPNVTQRLQEISADLKALALTLNMPVLCLHQLNRAVESRENKRPSLADLRDSGALEQDADVVLFVHREEYYLARAEPETHEAAAYAEWAPKMEAARGKLEILIDKHRDGATGVISVRTIMGCNAVRDWHDPAFAGPGDHQAAEGGA